MSYNDLVHYVAETNKKKPLKAEVKPSVDKLLGRNAPFYRTDDIYR